MKWLKFFKKLYYALWGIVILLCILVVMASFSQTGLRLLLGSLKAPLSIEGISFQVEAATGNLMDFTLPKLWIHTKTMQAQLTEVSVNWQPISLLTGKVEINTLSVGAITGNVQLKYHSSKHSKLRMHILVDHLNIKSINLKSGSATVKGQVQLQTQPILTWNVALQCKNVDLSSVNSAFSQAFDINISADELNQSISAISSGFRLYWHSKALNDNRNQFMITQVLINTPFSNWALKHSTTISINHNKVNLAPLCLDNIASLMCVKANWQPNNIQANLALHIVDLNQFSHLWPGSFALHGKLNGEIAITGNPASPIFHGQIELKNGNAEVPYLGLRAKTINLLLKANNTQMNLIGSAQSGHGYLRLQGAISNLLTDPSAKISLQAQNLLLADLPQINAYVSGQLDYNFSHFNQTLDGKLEVEKAHIQIDHLQSKSTAQSDIIFINNEGKKIASSPPWPIKLNLSLLVNPAVVIEGYGIHTNLSGHLLVHSLASDSLSATGKLSLQNGIYEAYGKRFIITQGELAYAHSPLDNPSLNVRALYDLPPTNAGNLINPSLQVGVNILGTLEKPQIELFSNPSMNEEDILSYIVLGKPFSEIQASDKNALSQAAMAIASSSGGNSVIDALQKHLGVSQIALGSLNSASPASTVNTNNPTAPDNTAIFIGKTINPRLYVRYGIGLFNNQQELDTSLQLSKYWSLKTNAGTQAQGADLVFTINR